MKVFLIMILKIVEIFKNYFNQPYALNQAKAIDIEEKRLKDLELEKLKRKMILGYTTRNLREYLNYRLKSNYVTNALYEDVDYVNSSFFKHHLDNAFNNGTRNIYGVIVDDECNIIYDENNPECFRQYDKKT